MRERVSLWIPLLPFCLLKTIDLSREGVPVAVDEIAASKQECTEFLHLSSAEWSLIEEVEVPAVLAHLSHPMERSRVGKPRIVLKDLVCLGQVVVQHVNVKPIQTPVKVVVKRQYRFEVGAQPDYDADRQTSEGVQRRDEVFLAFFFLELQAAVVLVGVLTVRRDDDADLAPLLFERWQHVDDVSTNLSDAVGQGCSAGWLIPQHYVPGSLAVLRGLGGCVEAVSHAESMRTPNEQSSILGRVEETEFAGSTQRRGEMDVTLDRLGNLIPSRALLVSVVARS